MANEVASDAINITARAISSERPMCFIEIAEAIRSQQLVTAESQAGVAAFLHRRVDVARADHGDPDARGQLGPRRDT